MNTQTEEALWMLEGSHGRKRDECAAVSLLEKIVEEKHDPDAMWLLGVCCEYGMGTQKDVERAGRLITEATQKGSKPAMKLSGKLMNKNGRGCPDMNLRSLAHHCFDERSRIEKDGSCLRATQNR